MLVLNMPTKLLLFFFLILSVLTISQPQWPKYFSHQGRINPETIHEEFDPASSFSVFDNQQALIPTNNQSAAAVLGETSDTDVGNKRIEVDLASQQVFAYEGDRQVFSFLISSGKWDRTPNGTFKIWTKIRSQKMSGGSKSLGTYYYLPNVPYIMFFHNDRYPKQLGFSLHGTYWHNNFGTPMSHGCVNMKTSEAALLYDWAPVGTPITIYGKFQRLSKR